MENFFDKASLSLMILGLGDVYLSRFLLRKQTKTTGKELFSMNSELEDIHNDYLVSSTFIFLLFSLFLYLVYKSDAIFWENHVFVLIPLSFIEFALYDAVFALSTKVFPTTTRYNWNSYVYDPDGKLRWVAFWQIGVGIALLLADYILFQLSIS